MDWLRELGRRVLMLVRRRRFDTDLEEEMSLHRELREQEQIERGLSSTEARYAAQRRFGNDLLLREASRDTWGWVWIETVWQDFRYSVRQLRKNPGFTAVIVITLALGIGANSAVFSVVNSLFLRALPVPERDRLVSFSDTNFSWTDYLAYRDEAKSFESLSTSYDLFHGEPEFNAPATAHLRRAGYREFPHHSGYPTCLGAWIPAG